MSLGPFAGVRPVRVIPVFYPMVKCGNAAMYTFPHYGDPRAGATGKCLAVLNGGVVLVQSGCKSRPKGSRAYLRDSSERPVQLGLRGEPPTR